MGGFEKDKTPTQQVNTHQDLQHPTRFVGGVQLFQGCAELGDVGAPNDDHEQQQNPQHGVGLLGFAGVLPRFKQGHGEGTGPAVVAREEGVGDVALAEVFIGRTHSLR